MRRILLAISCVIATAAPVVVQATASPASADTASAIVSAAESQLGVQYCMGGGDSGPFAPSRGDCSSGTGFDCSGLVRYAIGQATGIALPGGVPAQWSWAQSHATLVSLANIQPGDVIVFADNGALEHTGIYVGDHAYSNGPWSSYSRFQGSGPAIINAYDYGWGTLYTPLAWYQGGAWSIAGIYRIGGGSTPPPPPPPAAPGLDLVKNGGFEQGTSSWSVEPSTNFVVYSDGQATPAEASRDGGHYAATNTTINGGGIYQDVPEAINPGDTYCVSAFVRSQYGGTASGTLAIWAIGNSAAESGGAGYSHVGTLNHWTPLETCVTATRTHTAIRVQFYPAPNGGTTDIDDVNMTRSVVQNGGFEQGTSSWSVEPSTNFVAYSDGQAAPAEASRDGGHYAATNTTINGGGIYQDIPATINPGDTYCVSAFVRSQYGGTASGTLAIWAMGNSASEGAGAGYSKVGSLNHWTPLESCVTATRSHTVLRVQFYPAPNGGTTDIDDVSVALNPLISAPATSTPLRTLIMKSRPTISGKRRVGHTLTAHPGTWSPSRVAARYQWFLNGRRLVGATRSTLRLTRADRGKRVSVQVKLSRSGYATRTAMSAPTARVT